MPKEKTTDVEIPVEGNVNIAEKVVEQTPVKSKTFRNITSGKVEVHGIGKLYAVPGKTTVTPSEEDISVFLSNKAFKLIV